MAANAILLVEDSAADVYLIQRAVNDCDQDIRLWTMADGAEALQFLRIANSVAPVLTPALILLDLLLPKMSGTQLLAEIRQLPVYQATPIRFCRKVDNNKKLSTIYCS